jgi:Tfp pilus assembly protein FimT
MMRAGGYSFIELVVVLAVAAFLASLPVALFTKYTQQPSMTVQASVVNSALIQAHNMAISRNNCVQVSIVANSSVRVDAYAPVGNLCTGVLGASTISLSPFILAGGYTLANFNPGGNSIIFNTVGGLTSSTMVTTTLSDTRGQKVLFTIYPAIGQIRVSGP